MTPIPIPTVKIIFAGGGTGGHLFPAMAIADRVCELLKDRMKVEILFVGTKRGLEYRMKDSLGYPLFTINMRGITRSMTLKNLLVPFITVAALIKSSFLLNRFKPDLVIGTGGYVCWPVLKVAVWKKITTLLQEQNSFPGITIRQLARQVKKIYLGFNKAKEYLKTNAEIIVTGNPVRKSLTTEDREKALRIFDLNPDKKTILILGGSQGARAINNAVIKSFEKNSLNKDIQILWQTGKRDYKEVTAKTGTKVPNVALFPFSQQMEMVYAAADMVIARAGALTLAEITTCGLPSILIPYPFAAGNHQKKNAQDYEARGMAVLIDEKSLDNTDIITDAVTLLKSDRYQQMKQAIIKENRGKEPAVDIIAKDIIKQLESIKQDGGED